MSLEYDASTEDGEDVSVVLTKRDGTKDEYFIRTFDCAGRNSYLTTSAKRLRTTASGEAFIDDFNNLEASLLTKCLYHKDTGKLVTEKEVNGFPPKFAKLVYREAR